jgi:hypothetical protein
MITTFAAQSEGVDARQIVQRLVDETIQSGLSADASQTASSRG